MKKGIGAIVLSIVIIFSCRCELAFAQTKPAPDSYQLKSAVPPSPNAASLGKYNDIPVGYHTGTPNISIPIYELKEGDVTVPVSLSYHASGIRVAEVASWVGLGWTLNAGGMITRSVQHVPDEGPIPGKVHDPEGILSNTPRFYTGYYRDGFSMPVDYEYVQNFETPVPKDPASYNAVLDAAAGNSDTEPDLFFFNVGGYSGKFLFKVDVDKAHNTITRTPMFIPRSDVKVDVQFGKLAMPQFPTGSEARETFIGFTLTTPDGFRYYFGGQNAIEYTGNQVFNLGNHSASVLVMLAPSSWYLTRIESPTGRHIDFEYTSDTFGYYDLAPEKCSGGDQYLSLSDQMISRNVVNGRKLSRISSGTQEILFRAETIREDLSNYDNNGGGEEIFNVTTRRLDRIEINETNGKATRKFFFGYDYFRSNENSLFPKFIEDIPSLKAAFRTDKNRLRLDRLTEVSGDGTINLPPYIFTYINKDRNGKDAVLPRRLSYQQDHWGYYNHETLNRGLISFWITPRKNRRQTNDQYTQVAALKSIKYPMGGTTTFNYESHEAITMVENLEILDPGRNYVADSWTTAGNGASTSVSFETARPIDPGNQCRYFSSECDMFHNIMLKFRAGSPTGGSYNLNHLKFNISPAIEIYRQGESKALYRYEFGYLGDCATNDITCSVNSGAPGRSFREVNRIVSLSLPPGQYYARTFRYEGVNSDGSKYLFTAAFSIPISVDRDPNYAAPVTTALTKVGGLRIKSIVTSDGAGTSPDQVKTFSYPTTGGVLFHRPQYYYRVEYLFTNTRLHATAGSTFGQIWSSTGTLPMRTTQGNHIGYAWVREEQPGNGYKVYSYDVSEHPHHFANDPYFKGNTYSYQSENRQYSYPVYPAPIDLERGNLLSEEVYNITGKIVMSTRHSYEPSADLFLLRASKIEFLLAPVGIYYVGFTHYPLFTSTNRIRTTTVNTNYDSNGSNPTSVVTTYDYNGIGHLQATSVTKTMDDIEHVDRMIYPPDYGAMSTTTAGIKHLQGRNMINIPIEKFTIRKATGQSVGSVIDGTINQFMDDRPLPGAVYSLKIDPPLRESNFKRSNLNPGAFNADPLYEKRITYYDYDAAGNIRELSKDKDVHVTYLWGYSNTRLIAEIKNATLAQVFHTSFEDIDVNVSDSAVTGKRSWKGSYYVAPPSAGNYKLTYWQKNDIKSPWELIEGSISGVTTIGGPGTLIDEVRIHPVDAQMNTYTYDISSGIRSATDANNRATTYNYDPLGRLECIKDHNGEVLKTFSYNYSQNFIVTMQPLKGFRSTVGLEDKSEIDVAENVQYFDGLGRPLQNVSTRMSPASHDLVQPFSYDQFGRETRKYLPYVSSDGSGGFHVNAINTEQPAFYLQSGNDVARDTKPYAEAIFDNSPLNRIIKQGAVGETWQPNASQPALEHVVKHEYALNTVADSVVWFRYDGQAADISPSPGGYYSAGVLYRNKSIDEENNDVIEFVDKLNRTVCRKVKAGDRIYAGTYYVFDDIGNLVYVIPPAGVEALKAAMSIK